MPIFSATAAYRSFPFLCLHESARRALNQAASSAGIRRSLNPLLRLLENFLQVTGQEVREETLSSAEFEQVFLHFAGVIHSSKFIAVAPATRVGLTTQWLGVAKALRAKSIIRFNPTDVYSRLSELIQEVDALPLLPEKVELYSGWKVTSIDERTAYLHLYQLNQKFGGTFCRAFFEAIRSFIAGRRKAALPGALPEFIDFLVSSERATSPVSLTDRTNAFYLLRDFCIHYFLVGCNGENPNSIAGQYSRWRGFVDFYRTHLVPTDFFAAPIGSYPNPSSRQAKASIRHLSTTETNEAVTSKLLTKVPLAVTDAEAIKILFESIRSDIDAIERWATEQCKCIWERHQRRLKLQSSGKPTSVGKINLPTGSRKRISRLNPEWVANAAATFAKHGYLCARDVTLTLLYGTPLPQAAFELAMPTAHAFIPHCCILIIEHPAITDAFLEDHVLYDPRGTLIGIEHSDSGIKLIGHKPRRGSRYSRQCIPLSEKAAATLDQILAITQPARDYLRARGHDDWRYLLLSTGSAFGMPIRVSGLSSSIIYSKVSTNLSEQLERTASLSPPEAHRLAAAFSLTRLRASVGVRVYLDTLSVRKMSEALGHAECDPKLLKSYLPEPIARFFAERWVRIFQNAFVIEVMKDSPLLQRVTDFEAPEELGHFMSNHVLKVPSNLEFNERDEVDSGSSDAEVLFCLTPERLAALLQVSDSVSKEILADPVSKYWAAIADHLVAHIEEEMSDREDVQSCLAHARRLIREAQGGQTT